VTEAVRLYHDRPSRVDEVTLARIGREREEAGRRLAKTRDVAAWQREMARLDAEEQAAREPVEAGRLSSEEVVDYLRSLPSLWADAGPDGCQALATAIFARTDVMGFERLEHELTPDAIELGLDAALPAVFELTGTIGESGRGERGCPATNDLPITMRLAEPPEPSDWPRGGVTRRPSRPSDH
jgi:hypothetical protein